MARTLLQQGHGFSEQQRDALLAEHLEILDQVVPTMARGEADGLFEISVTPYHHPILPLLINSNVAVECMPQAPLPQPPITEAADAEWHVLTALNDWEARSGRRPRGMWPAEGSVSMEALGLMAAAGLHWTATDEAVLRNSLGDRYTEASPYLPYRVQTSSGAMSMLFRDHGLSDAIGFTYATWDAEDAVNDFVQRLADRRERILQSLPEDLHANAVIPVMLDGENCWEFYHGNGEAFLRRLLEVLAVDSRFQSVTASEATASVTGDVGGDSHQMLEKVVAGSWINGTFDVWIGTPTKNLAWSLLRAARNAVRHVGDPDHLLALVRSLEASDYFWWYDERHVAPHKGEFDAAFRSSLAGIFTACNIEPPCNLDLTMQELTMEKESTEREYPVSFAQSTMHEADAITKSLTLETDDNWQRISFHLYRVPDGSEEVIYTITDRHGVERRFGLTEGELLFQTPIHDEGFEHKTDTHLCAYLHTSMVWVVSVEEQRASGRVARTALTLAL
jgi:alpha-amylase/alpha-mannosidase (GH57 family)